MTVCLNRRSFLGATGGTAGLAAVSAGAFARGSETRDLHTIGKTSNTRFAVNVEMWFTGLPFLERIRRSAGLGFPAVEFWPWKNKDIRAIAKTCRDLNITVTQFTAWGFKPGLNNPENHVRFVEAVREGCRVARQLNCRMMTVVAGDDQPGMTQEQMHENTIAGLRKAAPIAEDHDVTLILEPMNIRVDHKGHSLYGSPPAIRICNEVNSTHVKINWDLYHMQITEGDLCGRMREGFESGRLGYLQLADHPGRWEPGTGEIHYNRVLREAKMLGYDYFVGLECRPKENELLAAKRVAAADEF